MNYPIFSKMAIIMQDDKATAIRETNYARRRFCNYLEEQLEGTDYTDSDKTHLTVAFIYLNDVIQRLIEDDYSHHAFNDMILVHYYFGDRTHKMLRDLEAMARKKYIYGDEEE